MNMMEVDTLEAKPGSITLYLHAQRIKLIHSIAFMFSPQITDVEAYHQLHKDFSIQPTHDPNRVRYVDDQCFVLFDGKWHPASSVWVYLSTSEPSMNLCSRSCQTEAPTKKKGRPVRLCSITEQNGWVRMSRNGKVSLHHLHFAGCQVGIASVERGRGGGGGKAIPLTAPRG